MPPDLAAAICESEVFALTVVLLAFGAGAAMEPDDEAMELDAPAAGEEPEAVWLAGAGLEAGAEAAAPEFISDFLLLRVRLAVAGVASLADAVLAGSVVASAAFLLFFLLLVPASPAVVELAEVALSASAEAAFLLLLLLLLLPSAAAADSVFADSAVVASDFLLFLGVFFDAVSLAVVEVSAVLSAFLLFFDFDFLVAVDELSAVD